MIESKFYDLITTTGNITINVNNVALIENTQQGTKITMNLKDKDGNYIVFITKLSWSQVSSDISQKDVNSKREGFE